MNAPKPVIEIKNVTKRYDDEAGVLDALNGVSLTVMPGDFVAIMGPSGSGKSTLMNIIGLLDRPTTGQYLLEGTDVSNLSDRKLARLRRDNIGFVFQAFNLLPRLNLLQNVEMPMIYQNIRASRRRTRASEVLKRVGLGDKLTNKPSQISGGQVQRAAIARALVNRPSLVLADEPTGNLDTKKSEEIMQLLRELNKKGVTIVVVTHNPEVADYAKTTVEVRDGLIRRNK